MNRLGDACFVSYYAPEAYKLSGIIETIPNVQKSWLTRQGRTWLFAWWKNSSLSAKGRNVAKAAVLWLVSYLNFATELLTAESYLIALA